MARSVGYITSKDGTRIGYERSGAGQALVLVHGTASDLNRWRPLLPRLEARFTVYAMDRRGRGLSGDGASWAIEREFEDVAAVINAVGERVHVFGHSFGALCAMEAALRTPSVDRMVLYEPYFRTAERLYAPGQRDRLQVLLDRGEREEALVAFLAEAVGLSEEQVEALRADATWSARLAAAHTIPREYEDEEYVLDPSRFARLAVPTLLLAGTESPRPMQLATAAAHVALRNSRVEPLQGQQHAALATAPDLVARVAIEFLGSGAA